MKKVLSLQIRKTIFSIEFLVFLGMAVMMSFVSVYFIRNINEVFGSLPKDMLETFRQGEYYNFLIIQVKSIESLNNPTLDTILPSILGSNSIAALLSICISKKITNEFRHKNFFYAVAKGYSRRTIYISYNIAMIILTVILSFAYVASFALIAVMSGISMENVQFGRVAYLIFVQMFMLVSYTVFCTTLSVIMQKAVSAILLNVSIVMALPAFFSYFRLFYHINFDFESFWILTRLSELTGRMPLIGDFVISIAVIAASLLIGILSLDNIKIKNE